MKLRKVLALTLLAATVGCAASPVAMKNVANNAKTTVVNVNQTGSITVPVTFPAISNFKTQGVDYAGGYVSSVYVTIQSVNSTNALVGAAQTFVLVRNALCTSSYAGGSSTVTFSNIDAGKAVVSVYTSDVAPLIGVGAGAAISAANAVNVVYDPATMAPVNVVAGSNLTQAQTVSNWMTSNPIVLFPVGAAAATVATDHGGNDATLNGFAGKLVTVTAGQSTAATLTVSDREPAIYDHSIPAANQTAGVAVALNGTNLVSDDLVVVDTDNSGTANVGDFVYPLTATSGTAGTFVPTKAQTAQVLIARGLNDFTADGGRQIKVVAGAIDISKSVLHTAADAVPTTFGTPLHVDFLDSYSNAVGTALDTGDFVTDLAGITMTGNVAAGNSMTISSPVSDDKATVSDLSAAISFTAAANAANKQVGGRKVVVTDSGVPFTNVPAFSYTGGQANFMKSTLVAGTYSISTNATKKDLTLKNASDVVVATYTSDDLLAAGTYTLKDPADNTTPVISFTLGGAPASANAVAAVVISNVRAIGYDTDVLTLTVTKGGVNKAFTITGSY
ncbi:MAG TPA: hypothetical protein DD435_06295 [Cyanobacteria bacterium UBA8530]|nr:hypothetical protein [Cyanobacteria bacterium UBA8530]